MTDPSHSPVPSINQGTSLAAQTPTQAPRMRLPIKPSRDEFQRITSPSPSRRLISHTRVNRERAREDGAYRVKDESTAMARDETVYGRQDQPDDALLIIYHSGALSHREEGGPPYTGNSGESSGLGSVARGGGQYGQSASNMPNGPNEQNGTPHGLSGQNGPYGSSAPFTYRSGQSMPPRQNTPSHLAHESDALLESSTLGLHDILPYYLPIASWIYKYDLSYFVGDLVGGLSLVFFQLPLSISYASSLAHVPIVCGLLSLAIAPLIYMVFGSVPQMITGPEAAISLIVGQAVEPLIHHKKKLDPMDLVVVITFISGATLLGFGLGRFGFLDNVLNGSLLKGFISGVGIIMAVGATVDMLGLTSLLKHASENGEEIHSCFDKARFVIYHLGEAHMLTFKISVLALIAVVALRYSKKVVANSSFRHASKVTYFPEILVTVAIATYLNSKYHWNDEGVAIVGKISRDVDQDGAYLYNPLAPHRWKLFKAMGTSGFLCAMLGFFESTTALKSLGSTYDLPISSNRELVALGFINIIGSMFGALPAFGGYGRSKINAMSAKTTVLGAIMGTCALITTVWLLDYLYYLPKCILSVVTATIGILLIEEAPYDLYFHWRARGYNELVTFFVTVVTTVFVSMEAGIAVGFVYLLIRVIKHSASSRIQILGRYPNTNHFVAAEFEPEIAQAAPEKQGLTFFTDEFSRDLNTDVLEEVEGCLIIRIPEPLTFTNANDLRARLRRVELYGSARVHPATKRTRSQTQYVIFDFKGMTGVDSSATQMLNSLLEGYRKRGIFSFFVRVHKDDTIRYRLKNTGIEEHLRKDLETLGYYTAHSHGGPYASSVDSANEIANLTEPNTPYLEHISDALKVIDYYENAVILSHSLLDIDADDRRSSLPRENLV